LDKFVTTKIAETTKIGSAEKRFLSFLAKSFSAYPIYFLKNSLASPSFFLVSLSFRLSMPPFSG